ncbi:hypothetical protein Y032_0014g2374 [Ancylostoma ceylanicum]|uniref:Uncharacterized protein n=1 Tax=Ancylostoma ceylanicum TaxID=53326 RepID=A0A016VA91_9BILA|nr:hypothetical protein Y032_0014g2374 [Ancylostoma ceylanicum]
MIIQKSPNFLTSTASSKSVPGTPQCLPLNPPMLMLNARSASCCPERTKQPDDCSGINPRFLSLSPNSVSFQA